MSPILSRGSENRDEIGCLLRPIEKRGYLVKQHTAMGGEAYYDCYHRAVQVTFLLEHRPRRGVFLARSFCVIIRHIKLEGGDVGDGIEVQVRVDTGW